MLVQVEWLDITASERPWMEQEEAEGLRPASIVTVGKLVADKENYVIVASSWGVEGELGNVNCIPKQALTKMERISVDVVVDGVGDVVVA